MLHTKELKISGNRKEIREKLALEFLKEEAGKGKDDLCSKYIYEVEKLADGKKVYLKRPARLNKGFDFEVNVENTIFPVRSNKTMPSHNAIIEDLKSKKNENAEEYEKVKQIIDRIYNCVEVDDKEILSLQFKEGYPIELIFKCIKWLFIKQDITYWNWSGRALLYSRINKIK